MNPTRNQPRRAGTAAAGFSLIETAIAIGVIAFTFIGIIGLLGVGLANDQVSTQQTTATNIVASIIADVRSTPSFSTTGKSTRYSLTLPTTVTTTPTTPLSGVTPTLLYFDNDETVVPTATGATYVAYVYMTQLVSVGAAPAQTIDMVRVAIAWPAQATTPTAGSVDIMTQFRTN